MTKIKFKSSIVSSIAFLHHHQQQQQQHVDMLANTPCMEIPPPKLLEELSPISESVVIPTDVKETTSEPNYWIIHQPN